MTNLHEREQFPRVEVRWLDANRHVYDDWTPILSLKPEDSALAIVHTCGYLIYESDDRLIVALQMDKTSKAVGDGMVIPRVCVQSVTELRDAKQ